MLVVLVGVLVVNAVPSVRQFGPGFLVSSEWRANELDRPVRDAAGKLVYEDGEVKTETVPPAFGALPVIYGTAMTSLIALLFAVPLSIGAALFIVRVAPGLRIAGPVSFLVEFLASIPSIAYGIWGLFVLAPFLRDHVEPGLVRAIGAVPGLGWLVSERIVSGTEVVYKPMSVTGRDLLCGGLILGIMILPIITAVSRDVLRTVPRGQIEGTVALGATWWQSCVGMLKYSRAGLFGAVMLGLARAAGETMAVAMVIGNNNQIVASPFAPAQTMSSLLANEFAEAGAGLHSSALLQVALILLVMSLVFNVVARWLVVGKGGRTAAGA
jgi:phosphate transport system permease protein